MLRGIPAVVGSKDPAAIAYGQNFKRLRLHAEMSQEAVAAKLGYKKDRSGNVSSLESGSRGLPKPATVRDHAKALGVEPWQLMEGVVTEYDALRSVPEPHTKDRVRGKKSFAHVKSVSQDETQSVITGAPSSPAGAQATGGAPSGPSPADRAAQPSRVLNGRMLTEHEYQLLVLIEQSRRAMDALHRYATEEAFIRDRDAKHHRKPGKHKPA